jgi:outer membrane protein assembly complex protein YaeT
MGVSAVFVSERGSNMWRARRESPFGRFVLLLSLLLALAPDGGVASEAEGGEEPVAQEGRPTVSALRFEGVEAVRAEDLREAILTTAPDWRPWRASPVFVEEDLRQDLDRIGGLYRDSGYHAATASYELDWNRGRSKVTVTIQVTEGEPTRLREWDLVVPDTAVIGAEATRAFRDALPLAGSVFGVEVYRDARKSLLEAVAELGHPAARIEGGAEVDTQARTADVRWVLRIGPPVVFGEISIEGLEDVGRKVVERELRFRSGERFSLKALRRSEKRIFETGLFRSVAIQPQIPDDDGVGSAGQEGAIGSESEPVIWALEVRVIERSPRSVRIGVGYGTEEFFRVQARWTHRNFLGGAQQLTVAAKYSDFVGGGEVELSRPYVFGWPARLDVRVSAVRETPRAYTAVRVGETVEIEFPILERIKGRLGHGVEFTDVTSQRFDLDDVELPEKTRLSTLLAGLRRSTLDDRIDPSRGTWLDLAARPSFKAIGSEVDYIELKAEARAFHSLGPVVVGVRGTLGTLQPLRSTNRDEIPSFKRFFAGGSTSVRGFSYQKLGALDDDGDPAGGLSLAEASVELRFPLYRILSGVLFSDAGDLQLRPFDWDPSDLYYSSGIGLRIKTPIGPLRFDVARLYNPPKGRDRYAFYLSVGHAF